jgi:hypothetical protein
MASMFICVARASNHACRRSGQHLVGSEKDAAIFNAISSPLHDSTPSPLIGSSQSSNIVTKDDKEHVRKVPQEIMLRCLSLMV